MDLTVIGCELVANAIDGNVSDAITNADVAAACGGEDAYGVRTALAPAASPGLPSIANLAQALGDQDGTLEKSDFSGGLVDEGFDDNQIGVHCANPGAAVNDVAIGFACTLDVFVFLERRGAGETRPALRSEIARRRRSRLHLHCRRCAATTRHTRHFGQ